VPERRNGRRGSLRLAIHPFGNCMDKTRPIIIVKKKGGHGGHHGGAWRVAYADFVTAMMSLFIVLWLLSSSKPVQEAVGGYFRDPNGTSTKKGTINAGAGENFVLNKDNMPKLKNQLEDKIRQMNDFEKLKSHVEMTVTSEGLRIELTESAAGTFFDSGSPKLNADGRELLVTLAQELGKLPNKLSIEGHTDSKPYATSGNYSNWELSTDRANAARRLVQANGIRGDQITQVRGFADQRLRKLDDPLDASNRRISLIVQYIVKDNDEEAARPSAAGEENKSENKESGGTASAPPPEKPSEKK
jgi:chemotaxis protein MotB